MELARSRPDGDGELARQRLRGPGGGLVTVSHEAAVELAKRQTELERQNLELLAVRAELERARDRYAELYDWAPVGYCTLERSGTIAEANLKAAALLGVERDALPGKSLCLFLDSGQRQVLRRHLARVLRCGDRRSLELRCTPRLDAEPRYLRLDAEPTRGEDGTPMCRCALLDVTEHRRLVEALRRRERTLEHRAHHDPLTDLPNRVLFVDRLRHALAQARRSRECLAVLFIDLDGFKHVNDTYGHDLGDELLKQVAARLTGGLRESDTVARLGGDEFTLVLAPLADAGAAGTVAEKLSAALREPYAVGGRMLAVSSSIGIGLYPEDGRGAEELICRADEAMYRAKQAGRDTFRFYADAQSGAAQERELLAAALREPTPENQLMLHYQPEIAIPEGRVLGIEALVRWQHPQHGRLLPARLLPLADAAGLSAELGDWVLRTACTQLLRWQAAGLRDDVTLKVNCSGHQLQQPGLVDAVARLLRELPLPAWRLRLEVPEASVMPGAVKVLENLRRLQGLGVSAAIDDFGSGYASLSQLKRLPVAELKIARGLVAGVPGEEVETSVTRAILALAASLGLCAVAEGVETPAQAQFLVAEGCAAAQGYFYAPPLPPEDLLDFAAKRH